MLAFLLRLGICRLRLPYCENSTPRAMVRELRFLDRDVASLVPPYWSREPISLRMSCARDRSCLNLAPVVKTIMGMRDSNTQQLITLQTWVDETSKLVLELRLMTLFKVYPQIPTTVISMIASYTKPRSRDILQGVVIANECPFTFETNGFEQEGPQGMEIWTDIMLREEVSFNQKVQKEIETRRALSNRLQTAITEQ